MIRVIDTETTGLPEEGGKVCEIGWTDVYRDGDAWKLGETQSLMIDPGCPIPPIAKAVHHIQEWELVGAPTLESVLPGIMLGREAYAAHNAKFEQAMLGGVGWLCTFKVACRLFPDAERHSNQYLRYALGLDADDMLASPPHRAAPDSYVTALLLIRMLQEASLEQMLVWSAEPALLPRINFGKHHGQRWADVARSHPDYLQWALGQDFDEDVHHTARHWLSGGR